MDLKVFRGTARYYCAAFGLGFAVVHVCYATPRLRKQVAHKYRSQANRHTHTGVKRVHLKALLAQPEVIASEHTITLEIILYDK